MIKIPSSRNGNLIKKYSNFKLFSLKKKRSILALRNLCQDNLENQEILQKLKPEGIKDSELQEEMGIRLELDKGEIKIKKREN